MKILITGGLGFIGHGLVRNLEAQGHATVIADCETDYGVIPRLELDALVRERRGLITTPYIYRLDIARVQDVNWLIAHHRPDLVIHLASFPRQKVVNNNAPAGSRVMSEALLGLLDACAQYQVPRFVYVSSSMVYGDFVNVTAAETDPCHPRGQYAILKLAGEWLVKDYTRRTGLSHVIIRPTAVYGPRDVEDRVVSRFLLQAMRGQTIQVRGANELLDFTHVDDTVKGIELAALNDNSANRVYNISRGRSRSLLEAAETAVAIAGRGQIAVLDRDQQFPSRGQLNTQAAQQDLGFQAHIDIEQGFRDYHDWLVNSVYGTQKTV